MGVVIVNVIPLLVPFGVVTVTLWGPATAFAAMTKLVVNCVEVVTVTAPTVIPAPLSVTPVAPLTKFVPVMVTVPTVVPMSPLFGEICVMVGTVEVTVKPTALLVPVDVATVTWRNPGAALAAIMKLVLI
jgi:hypothetical protein